MLTQSGPKVSFRVSWPWSLGSFDPGIFQDLWISDPVSAVDFLHKNFSNFLQNIHVQRDQLSIIAESKQQIKKSADPLTDLLLALLKVNGSPMIDVSLDLAPSNSSKYIGVIRVPQRAALLPRLVKSRRDYSMINKWVNKVTCSLGNSQGLWSRNLSDQKPFLPRALVIYQKLKGERKW